MKRIQEKMEEIERYFEELEGIVPQQLEMYTQSNEKKAACERYVEKIVEAVVDLAFFIIKLKRYRLPDDDGDAFTILVENKVIEEHLSKKLKSAKGMRNVLAHQYGKVDDGIIFEALTQHLEKDVNEFLICVKKMIISKSPKSSRKRVNDTIKT